MIKLVSSHYWRQLGLLSDPFPEDVSPLVYSTREWQHSLNFLLNTEQYRKALLLVVGKAGVGKTTLLNQAAATLSSHHKILKLEASADLQPEAFLTCLAQELYALPLQHQANLQTASDTFLDLLQKTAKNYILIIEAADSLSAEVKALCLYLVKQQILTKTCLQIILVGTEDLPSQLKQVMQSQRDHLDDYIIQILSVTPFDRAAVEAYLKEQLKVAGHTGQITFFAPDDLDTITAVSQGFPVAISREARRVLQNLVKLPTVRFQKKRSLKKGRLVLLIVLLGLLVFVVQDDMREKKLADIQLIPMTPVPSLPMRQPPAPPPPQETYPSGSHLIVNGEIRIVDKAQPVTPALAASPTPATPEKTITPATQNSLQARERLIIDGEIQNLPKVLGQVKGQDQSPQKSISDIPHQS